MTYDEMVEVMAKAPHPEAWDSYPGHVRDVIRHGMSAALAALWAQGLAVVDRKWLLEAVSVGGWALSREQAEEIIAAGEIRPGEVGPDA